MPAFLLVYFASSRTSSVITEKDIAPGSRIDVGETVSVMYENGQTYDAEVIF